MVVELFISILAEHFCFVHLNDTSQRCLSKLNVPGILSLLCGTIYFLLISFWRLCLPPPYRRDTLGGDSRGFTRPVLRGKFEQSKFNSDKRLRRFYVHVFLSLSIFDTNRCKTRKINVELKWKRLHIENRSTREEVNGFDVSFCTRRCANILLLFFFLIS